MQQPGDNLVGRMVGLYATHAPLALEKILEVAGTEDCRQLAQAAHALKSLSLSVGAKRNAALCAALELDASRGCGERKVENLISLQTAMPLTIAELRKFEADRCVPLLSEYVIAAVEGARKSS
jgi:two-component system sensor histidine kinase BarA